MRMNNNKNVFDNLLKTGLKKHAINVPQDFAQKMLTSIQREEYADALVRIRRSERLLVAAMIIVPAIAALVFLLLGPQIIAHVNVLAADVRHVIASHAANAVLPLKYLAGIAAIAAVLIYTVLDQILAEN
jgi:hypothetical protein